MNPSGWTPPPSKARIYESLYSLNRGFEISLTSLEQLDQLGIFCAEELRALKVSLEFTRALANEELTETLQQYEADQSAHFDQLQAEREKRFKDPDDVFLAAADRKGEIKEQIRRLQKSLNRQKPTRRQKRR